MFRPIIQPSHITEIALSPASLEDTRNNGTNAIIYSHRPDIGNYDLGFRCRYACSMPLSTCATNPTAGSVLSISFFTVPSMLLAPSPLLARQWQASFDRGAIINPAIGLVSVFAYGFLSYRLYGSLNHPKAEMYALSALFVLGMLPWTRLVMWPTNVALFRKYDEMKNLGVEEKATEVGLAKGESTKELVDRWGTLNVVRGLFPLVGAVLGTWSTLS